MGKQIIDYLTIGFCFLWAFLIILDYWCYHPIYALSFENFQYLSMMAVLTLLGGGIGYVLLQTDWKWKPILKSGIGVIVLSLLICAIVIVMHFSILGLNLELSAVEVMQYVGKIAFYLSCTYLIFGACYVLGAMFSKYLLTIGFQEVIDAIIIKIGLGVAIVSVLLFFLGAFNWLLTPIMWGIILLPLVLFWKETLYFLKVTLFQFTLSSDKPKRINATTKNKAKNKVKNKVNAISDSNLNWLGYFSFYGTLLFLCLIALQNIRPVPYGFDALAIYMNLPKLIYSQEGLVEGFSPYYWSLFVTLGYTLVDRIELVIYLSVAGGVLSSVALFAMARKWLSVNHSLFSVLLFYALPLVNFQSYKDIKTDLGLLFFLMVIALIFINFVLYLFPADKEKEAQSTNLKEAPQPSWIKSKEWQYALIMGILSGIALGSKLTTLILIFSIVAAFFYLKAGQIGFITSLFITFFVMLMAKLEEPSGLRAFHFGADSLKWVVLGCSVLGIGFLIYKYKSKILQLVMLCGVYILFIILIYLPWPIKHYQETKVLNFQTIIEGKPREIPVIK